MVIRMNKVSSVLGFKHIEGRNGCTIIFMAKRFVIKINFFYIKVYSLNTIFISSKIRHTEGIIIHLHSFAVVADN